MAKSLSKIATIVSLGTILSKLGGLVRQLIIAGTFGIGSAYDAYNYAYIIPGFFLILIGGINGPFHNSIVSVLSRKKNKEAQRVLSTVNTIIGVILIILSAIILAKASIIISILGPGLNNKTHEIAVIQLRIMSPIVFLSGFIGIGFGSLNARNDFFIASISPIISSFTIIVLTGIFWINNGAEINSSENILKGGVILAIATLIGAILQWIFQIPSLINKNLFKFKLSWAINNKEVKEILKIITPATLSSGMLQLNVITDLFFASKIVGAAASLGYASFLIQAPLGLISNALLIPLLPVLSKFAGEGKQKEFLKTVRKGLIYSSISMVLIGAIFVSLCNPIVEIVYGRGAFGINAINSVSKVLLAYGVGMQAYLSRDLLVRVFYSQGDAKTPFNLSTIGIILNIIFDWILVGGPTTSGNIFNFNFGTQGIVLATVIINIITSFALLIKLKIKTNGFLVKEWLIENAKITFSGLISGCCAFIASELSIWPLGFQGIILKLITCTLILLTSFILTSKYLNIKEVSEAFTTIKEKIIRL